jgi:hypothetical protein
MADAARGRPWRTVVPSHPAGIAGLVSPLRYDILVRARFFRLLDEHRDRFRADRAALHAAARDHAYRVWFRELWCTYWAPHLLDDPAGFDRAYARRVDASWELKESFDAHGLDPARPITLHRARTGRRLFAGDGCHRLALLLLAGEREVPAGAYRIRQHLRLPPGNATDLLVPLLGVPDAELRAFVAWGERADDLPTDLLEETA